MKYSLEKRILNYAYHINKCDIFSYFSIKDLGVQLDSFANHICFQIKFVNFVLCFIL